MNRLISFRNFSHSVLKTKKLLSTAQIIRPSSYCDQMNNDQTSKKLSITTSRSFNSATPNGNGVEKVSPNRLILLI